MFLKPYPVLVLSFCFLAISPAKTQIKVQPGKWNAYLQITTDTKLPFRMEVVKNKKNYTFSVHNAEETIILTNPVVHGDSASIDFPNFHSTLKFKIENKQLIKGYWTNYNKGVHYKIPFAASLNTKTPEPVNSNNHNFSGRWKTTFDPNTKDAYMAVGVFKANKESIYGTFLTETGDYRFLEGKVNGNDFTLSCFDGSHAFHFTGKLENEKISGNFYSGKHFKGDWIAEYDPEFKLRNPDSLTYLVKTEPFAFKMKNLEGNDFSFPNPDFYNKVTIIQIMGTWCPNCMDETEYFKELYQKYHDKGLEVIAIGYETPHEFKEQAEKIKLLKQRHQLDFIFLVGGTANKGLASEQFSMLNQIISYPTSIIIGKDGEVKKIHTGFNGPGTGKVYLDYVKETNAFIEELLK